MNVFEYLGLGADPRVHPVMLVKHREEVPKSKLVFPVYGQVKRDGVFSLLIVIDGKSAFFGRTGLAFVNTEALAEKLQCLPDGAYMGELLTSAPAELAELSGVVNPSRVKELDWHGEAIKKGLYVDFYDFLPLKYFIEGGCQTGYLKRHAALCKRVPTELIEGGYCNVLPYTQLNNEQEVEEFATLHIAAGEEGAVFKVDCEYEAGHKGWRQTKKVREVTFDLTCVGWEEGKGKYKGKVANLVFKWVDGKTIKAMLGKGWTHEDAEQMFNDIKNGGELNVVGRIFQVYGLQESSKGKIRNPKVGELRHDKGEPDVY